MQQFQIKWNNHLKIFSKALSKFFEDKKFLDVILVVENGNHIIQCHKMVLAACSTYFANIFKCNLLDDKNPVICLPSEIQLWEIQAILNYMYNGEVCISQEGLKNLVKCAELLQVKGLWRNEKIDNVNVTSTSTTTSTTENTNDPPNYSDMIIKTEIDIDDIENQKTGYYTHSFDKEICADNVTNNKTNQELLNSHLMRKETENLERTKKSLHKKDADVSKNNPNANNCQKQFENIICSPILYWREQQNVKEMNEKKVVVDNQQQENKPEDEIEKVEYNDEEQEEDEFDDNSRELSQHQMLFSNEMMIDNDEDCNLLIASVSGMSEDSQQLTDDKKSSINGLYLRNPRGNQTRQYDVNSLYLALEDVRNGISIYRAAQTYNIPRKTLRNWMKRLHIKSKFPMPKQLAKAAERKKSVQMHTSVNNEMNFKNYNSTTIDECMIEKI